MIKTVATILLLGSLFGGDAQAEGTETELIGQSVRSEHVIVARDSSRGSVMMGRKQACRVFFMPLFCTK